MPTARELLEQADALMRRNRAAAVDDIPVLTDSVALPVEMPTGAAAPAFAEVAAPPAVPAAQHRLPEASLGALLRLAGPLMLTNVVQAALNLTDTWFLGRLSTDTVATMSAIYWLMTCAIGTSRQTSANCSTSLPCSTCTRSSGPTQTR